MKYFRLVWANLWRKKTRTILTTGSFCVALFLFGLLAVIDGAFSQGIEVAGVDRLMVLNRTSIIQPLPISYQQRLMRVQGVREVTYASWFGGVYQDPRNFFPQFAVEPESYRTMYPEFVIPEAQWKEFMADRQGVVVGKTTADRFGWKLGDRIPIQGTIFSGLWEFNVRAIYTGARPQDDTTQFWFHRTYLEENGPQWVQGLIGWYIVRIADPDDAVRIVREIDGEFANSPYETRTDTEKAFAAGFVRQIGNIRFLMLTIGSVVFFTLLLVTGNTWAAAVRERTPELAVLKSIGFGDVFTLGLVLAESVLVAMVGGLFGLALAKAWTLGGDPTGGMLPVFYLPWSTIGMGVLLTLAMGAAAGALPALAARRLRVVDALRKV